MITRYSRKEMADIWSEENKFRKWLVVEVFACEAHNKLGNIPDDALKTIKEKADFKVDRINEIEETVKHDVISFLTSVSEFVGEDSRFIHLGMTSSDVLDTGLAIQLKEASDIILANLEKFLVVLKDKAYECKDYITMGRSHGVHAEPTTFGLKIAIWYDEMKRNLKRMQDAKETICFGKISGPVGTFSNIDPFVEEYVCSKAGLKAAPVSNQIVQRDRHAHFMTTLAIIASSLDKIATEIRLLQHSEIYEAEESFTKGQKGSSAMPHKRNPIISERLSGLARVIRANSVAALENVPLWHERDISHSSVERIILPDSTILIDYMLNKAIGLIKNLTVYPENMLANIQKTKGMFFSQKIMLSLIDKGISREDSYAMVQGEAMKVWKEGADFKELILGSKEIMSHINETIVDEIFNIKNYVSHVDTIFKRVFGSVKNNMK